ncbi:hypothetical protein [Bacillus mobilis]|nr:hypothetical protein [Bacillus mobilis]
MARSEQEGVGSPDEEALFASQEEVKPPELDYKEWKQQRFIKNKRES